MVFRVLWVLAAFAVLFGCGQASSPVERQEEQGGMEQAEGREESPGSAAQEKPGVGDTQNVGEVSLTLVEAFRTDGDEEELFRDQVPPNGTFVVVRVRAQNGSPEPIKWGKPYIFQAYSTDGRKLNDAASLYRQIDTSAPREDLALYNTEIRPGGDVTGTIVCIVELDESVSLEFSRLKETESKDVRGLTDLIEAEAVWEFGPVGELPKQTFESQF